MARRTGRRVSLRGPRAHFVRTSTWAHGHGVLDIRLRIVPPLACGGWLSLRVRAGRRAAVAGRRRVAQVVALQLAEEMPEALVVRPHFVVGELMELQCTQRQVEGG